LTENALPERGMRGKNQGACKTASAISLAIACHRDSVGRG
jgi:hypothetical protein